MRGEWGVTIPPHPLNGSIYFSLPQYEILDSVSACESTFLYLVEKDQLEVRWGSMLVLARPLPLQFKLKLEKKL